LVILNPMSTGFTGGVHPPENKNTEKCAIEVVPPSKRVYIHFSQHTGKPARPLVEKGSTVKIGTKIGESDGFISASIHSSIAGKVIDIAPYAHPVVGSSMCCIIESAENEEWEHDAKEGQNYETMKRDELLNIIEDSGIVGLGGAAFPTHVKLAPPQEKPIDTLIINGCECEPMLTADHRLMLEFPTGIIEGAKIFQKILNAKNLIFGVENNKKDAAELLKKEGVDIRLLKTKYPQGAEKQLIKAILNREVPRGGLPMDVGCVVQNVGTSYAAFQAVKFRKPLVDRVITLTGDGVKESKNLLVRIGTPAIDIINFCGGYVSQPKMIVFGGPMMGIAQYTENVPVIKGTSGILVWISAKVEEEGPCVRCAQCVDSCPMGLMPTEIYKFVKNKLFNKAKDLGILDCIECGCCAYACPAKIPLVHYLKYGKSEVWRLSKK
jgi:electron transport complex protein RnfC